MSQNGRILVVDDMKSFQFLISRCLEDAGYSTTCVSGGSEALVELERSLFDLVISDLVMPGMDGVALLRQARHLLPRLPFVLVTDYGTVDGAVAAIKEGADDYLLKPLNADELLVVVERLLVHARLRISHDRMLNSEREKFSFQNIISCSPAMREVLTAAQQVAASPKTTTLPSSLNSKSVGVNDFTPKPLIDSNSAHTKTYAPMNWLSFLFNSSPSLL